MHKLLERQLLRAGLLSADKRVPDALQPFIRAIDEAYQQADADRLMLERSLELTSQELLQKNTDLRATAQQISKQHEALLGLAQNRNIYEGDLEGALHDITEAAAKTLKVERASVWILDEKRSKIVCIDLFEQKSAGHLKGLQWIARQYPVYFAALGQERTISVKDAWTDFRTTEFLESYLRPHRICALLDAPIRLKGKLVGVACHEHVGSTRAWTLEEQQFAGSIADMIALAMEAAERKRAENEIQSAYDSLRKTQGRLVESEKLATLGQFAAGIAHELKNPLAVILQGEHYLRSELPLKESIHHEVLGLIQQAVVRADKIIRGLLDLARPSALQIVPNDINQMMDTAFSLSQKQCSIERISVIKEYARTGTLALADTEQMQQVLINLICNAIQAMPQGGALTLRTSMKTVTENDAGVGRRATDFFRAGDEVVVCEVQDTGAGISHANISKIFDPFFTTKPKGEGTGLGLSIVRAIVEAHHGLLAVRSQELRGTAFTVMLPAAKAGAPNSCVLPSPSREHLPRNA